MSMAQTFRKKPVEIQAVQWTGENIEEMVTFVKDDSLYFAMDEHEQITDLFITTLEGDMKANVGDWIICGLKGEYYPCSNEIFVMSYDKVDVGVSICEQVHTHAVS